MLRTVTMKTPLVLLAVCLALDAGSTFAQSNDKGIETIVGAIEALESKNDPKCHATATRLENFMYGTPLTEEARAEKVTRQKSLILRVWRDADADARAAGESVITLERIAPHVEAAFPVERNDDGDALVSRDGRTTVVTARDLRQYGSVAYALRAILSVQQDVLLSSDLDLLPLDPGAVQRLKETIDVATLAALQEADRFARDREAFEVAPEAFAHGWARVLPPIETDLAAKLEKPSAVRQPGELLRAIIAQKTEAFREYNEGASFLLLMSNVRSYYARHELPRDGREMRRLTGVFTQLMTNFVGQFIHQAEEVAKAEGSAVVREPHVARVFRNMAPFEVDEFEDITYFSHLPSDTVVLEAYDTDSFRDSGLHWLLILQTIDKKDFALSSDFDPFAAELLAEGAAQLGVLLYRLAGDAAKEAGAEALQPQHLVEGAREFVERMKRHLATPAPEKKTSKLASAPSGNTRGRYFEDRSAEVGIRYMHRTSPMLKRFERTFLYSLHAAPGAPTPATHETHSFDHPPTYSGSGVAADDLDGDGWDDILIVGGLGNRLYRNNGDGTFDDLSESVDLTHRVDGEPGEARQPLLVDLDNDGLRDVVITYVNARHRVYRNLGSFRFEDVSDRASLGGEGLVGSAATALDFDRDGLLDLYVSYYGNYFRGEGPHLARINDGTTPNRLFRNAGGFRFEDVTERSGTGNTGWTQSVAAVDIDQDGWQDLVVGNDMGVNSYYRNRGDGTFEDVAEKLGARRPSNSMNVGTADLNRDGFPDVYISNILIMVKDEKYVNPTRDTRMKLNPEKMASMRLVDANHLFTSVASDGRLAGYTFNDSVDRGHIATGWAWDADFFDLDNDGDDDLYCVNGLNEYNIFRPTVQRQLEDGTERTVIYSVHELEPNVLFVNDGGKLRNWSEGSGADLLVNSRSAAYLDYDGDGDLDVVLNNYQQESSFLVNTVGSSGGNWLKVRLIGSPANGVNLDAIGSSIIATTESGNRIWRSIQGGTGYLSDHPKVQHFGLGDASRVDLEIRWPNGETTRHTGLEANRLHEVRYPAPAAVPEIAASPAGNLPGSE